MTVTLPAWLRRTLYILTALGAPAVLYARAKGWIGDLELTLWGAEVTVVTSLAAFKASDPGTVTAGGSNETTAQVVERIKANSAAARHAASGAPAEARVSFVSFVPGRNAPYSDTDPDHPKLQARLDTSSTPASVDWTPAVTSWPMYLNDREGSCTCAGAGHAEQCWSGNAGTEFILADADVQKAYVALTGYNPKTGANDTGAVMQDVLDYWRKTGIGGRKIAGFGHLDHGNVDQIKAAINAFGGVYVGVNLPKSAEDQFNAGQDWTVVKGSPILGGHCIVAVAYDAQGVTFVTWGGLAKATWAWWAKYVEEAWGVASHDWFNAQGSTPAGAGVADFDAEFTALTGQPSPFQPGPNPGPTPGPTPSGPVLTADLAARLSNYVETGHLVGLKAAARAAGIK